MNFPCQGSLLSTFPLSDLNIVPIYDVRKQRNKPHAPTQTGNKKRWETKT